MDRQALPVMVFADLLEELHSRSHPLCRLPSPLDEATKVRRRSDGGGAKLDVRTGAKSDVRAHAPHPRFDAGASDELSRAGLLGASVYGGDEGKGDALDAR
jgi:hypothetical protein